MVVEVHLHTTLQRVTEKGKVRKLRLTLQPDTLLEEVLKELDIQLPADGLIMIVNGCIAETMKRLNDGDIIHLIPALSGG